MYSNNKCGKGGKCVVDDALAEELAAQFRRVFKDTRIVTLPSENEGVALIAFLVDESRVPTFNGLRIKSQLFRTAFYSTECAKDQNGQRRYTNFFQIAFSDIPGRNGEQSTVEAYADELERLGIHEESVIATWTGTKGIEIDAGFKFVSSSGTDVKPQVFVKKTIEGLLFMINLIAERVKGTGLDDGVDGADY